jgi:hypothetical protein
MKLSDITKNLWLFLAVLVMAYIFLNYVGFGIGIKDWFLGAPTVSPSGVICSGGTYFDGTQCKVQNLVYIFILVALLLAAYFFLMGNKGSDWISAKEACRNAFENGHLQTKDGRDDFVAVWSHVEEPIQIVPYNAWLLIGDFVQPGREYSAMIAGTDVSGWVLQLWRYQLVDRQINILKKKGMELDKALSEVAAYRARTKATLEAVKENDEVAE